MSTAYAAEEFVYALIPSLITNVPSVLFGIVSYVFSALALYAIAVRRGLNKPWLSWIPVLNAWIVGSLSDQYRYVVKGENKSKRKLLLALEIAAVLLTIALLITGGILFFDAMGLAYRGVSGPEVLDTVLVPGIVMLVLVLPLSVVSITGAVIYYMALYDVYKSLDPDNCALFLVLSILFRVTEPFFLFFNRNKDLGMPPRRPEPGYVPPREPQWQETKDYL